MRLSTCRGWCQVPLRDRPRAFPHPSGLPHRCRLSRLHGPHSLQEMHWWNQWVWQALWDVIEILSAQKISKNSQFTIYNMYCFTLVCAGRSCWSCYSRASCCFRDFIITWKSGGWWESRYQKETSNKTWSEETSSRRHRTSSFGWNLCWWRWWRHVRGHGWIRTSWRWWWWWDAWWWEKQEKACSSNSNCSEKETGQTQAYAGHTPSHFQFDQFVKNFSFLQSKFWASQEQDEAESMVPSEPMAEAGSTVPGQATPDGAWLDQFLGYLKLGGINLANMNNK